MDLLLLTFLGGLLALDGTSFGQFQVSRPLVAGTLTGWAVEDPVLGLLMGGILEFYFISVFPVGGGHFPEGGAPTLVAVATAVVAPGPAGIALGAFMGFLWSRLGAISTRCGLSEEIFRLQKKVPGTNSGSTQWSPLQGRRLSSKTVSDTFPITESHEAR